MDPEMDGLFLLTKIVDGDSANGSIHFDVSQFDGWTLTAWKEDRFRLINLDTPERGHRDWARAKADLAAWLGWPDRRLRVRTYGRDSFGRVLADIYEVDELGHPTGQTATQWMLTEGDWLPWVPPSVR